MDELEAMVDGLGLDEPTRGDELKALLAAKTALEQELLERHEVIEARTPEGRELHSRLDLVRAAVERNIRG